MINDTIFAKNCELNLLDFVKNISEGHNKIKTKFISDLLVGIFKSNSVLLSDISRNSIVGCTIKKSIDRLSRQLYSFDSNQAFKNYINKAKENLPQSPLYIIDDTDIAKPLSTRMEGLGSICDGSNNHAHTQGYLVNEIVAISNNGQPISVASHLYSPKEKEFQSANTITMKTINYVINNVGSGTFIADRGFDNVKLYAFLQRKQQDFIIRCKKNRDVIVNDRKLNIKNACQLLKGKYSFKVRFQSGLKDNLKASFKKVRLPSMPNIDLNLVMVYGFHLDDKEPFMILTNKKLSGKADCIKVVMNYLSRWKIEEYFKFKKQVFGFEKIRLSKLKALKNLNLFLTMVIGFIGKVSHTILANLIMKIAQPIKEKVAFIYYRIANGLKRICPKFKTNIREYLFPPKPPKQYDLFHYAKYQKHHLNFTS